MNTAVLLGWSNYVECKLNEKEKKANICNFKMLESEKNNKTTTISIRKTRKVEVYFYGST
jgi:hypothetical protein